MNRIGLIKKILPGFLPLFIFIIADEIWGITIGLIVALVFGSLELIYTFIKEKRFDKFILIDTSLLFIMGGISIVLENDIFFKLKPAIIEGILCVVLGFSAFSQKNIIFLMGQRYMKNIGEKIQFNQELKLLIQKL